MKMKKRVLCVYDGQRRLWKDDMMLDADYEVRMKLRRQELRDRSGCADVETERGAAQCHGRGKGAVVSR